MARADLRREDIQRNPSAGTRTAARPDWSEDTTNRLESPPIHGTVTDGHNGLLGRRASAQVSLTHAGPGFVPHSFALLIYGGFQLVDSVGQILEPTCGVDIEPVENQHRVIVRVL